MYRIMELKKKVRGLSAKLKVMRNSWKNRSATNEELDEANKTMTEIEEITDEIRTLERVEKVEDTLRQSNGPTAPPNPEYRGSNFNNRMLMDQPGETFSSFGEQLRAVVDAGTPGRETDPRLFEVRAASGLSKGISSEGGFLVEETFVSRLMENIWNNGDVASRCTRNSITGNTISIPGFDETSRADGSRQGGVRAYWAAEAAEKTSSKPVFRKIMLSLEKLIGLCYVTDELLDDVPMLGAWVQRAFASEFDFKLQDAIINGTGAGMPLGILNSGCVITQDKEVGQAAATLVLENIVKMWSRMIASSRKNAAWLISQNVEPQLYTLSMAVGTGGGPVFLPGGGLSGSPYSTLFGRPVIPIEQCQTLGTEGDIILADFSQYQLVDKVGGMQSDVSIHVRFIYDETAFRFVLRVEGQPMWESAITPFNGGDTLSPFVTLQTRS